VAGALERSCNCYFYQVGQELGVETLSKWGEAFGVGVKSGIELGDVAGQLPRSGRRYTDSDARFLAIGQAELTVTPVQVSRLISVVANGGVRVTPHVVRGNGSNEPLPIRPGTLEAVREGLHAVTHGEHGTAHTSGLSKYDVSGKTSSAQTGKDPATGEDRESHAWFAGYTKDVAVVVLVEFGGGGGLAAAPVAAKILEKLK
jgi:penicillin-binding protein 2